MNRLVAGFRVPRIDPRWIDAALALAAITAGQLDIWLNLDEGSNGATVHAHHLLTALLSLTAMSMLLLRRRAPVVGLAVMVGALVLQVRVVEPVAFFLGGFVPVMFMAYAVGAYGKDTGEALKGLAVALVGALLIMLSVPELRSWDSVAFDLITLTVAWGVGSLVGSRDRRADELELRALELEHDRGRLIEEERARLARELHDIVAH